MRFHLALVVAALLSACSHQPAPSISPPVSDAAHTAITQTIAAP